MGAVAATARPRPSGPALGSLSAAGGKARQRTGAPDCRRAGCTLGAWRAAVARHYLVIDVEATCWDNQPALARESETIEIGAVLLDPETGATRAELQSFVRPVRHPRLSPHCARLTSITQADVDGAPRFPEVVDRLRAEILDRHQVHLASWGDYDLRQLERDCRLHRVKLPFGKRHLDVKQLFADRWHCRPCGMFQALEMSRLGLVGTHHRALDDARNVTRLLVQLLR